MCGRYILVQKIELLERRFNAITSDGIEWNPNYNISVGSYAPIVIKDNRSCDPSTRGSLRAL